MSGGSLLDRLGLIWERIHFLPYGWHTIDAPGVDSRWTQGLQPVGDRELLSGELIELVSTLPDTYPITPTSRIRFDILEEDWFLAGLDDQVVTLMGPNADPPDDGFTRAPRTYPPPVPLQAGQTLKQAVDAYVAANPIAFETSILAVLDPAGKQAHLVTWWRVRRLEDFFGSEYYFLLNLDSTVRDGTKTLLNVSATPRDKVAIRGHVETPAGKGVASAPVKVLDAGNAVLGSTLTAPNGDYQLDVAFAANVSVVVAHGFVTSPAVPVAVQETNRIEPLVVPPISVSGFSVTGTVLWPSWKEPTAATAAGDRAQLTGIPNHFTYTAAPEAFTAVTYDYDRSYHGQPLADVRLVAIKRDSALGARDGPGYRQAVKTAATSGQIAEAVTSADAASLGRFTFDNSLVEGDYVVGPREAFRLLTGVVANAENRFTYAAVDFSYFFRMQVDATGNATINGQAFADGRLYALPLIDPSDDASKPAIDALRRNLAHDTDAAFRTLLAATPVVDVGRIANQLRTPEEQDLLLRHTVVQHSPGVLTLLYDHALTGHASDKDVARARLPWVPVDDELLIGVRERRITLANMSSADFARYPLKRLEQAGQPRIRAGEFSREVGDDVREVLIRLVLWASDARPLDANVRGFDQAAEEALVRFKVAYDRSTPKDAKVPLVLGYVDKDAAATKKLYPDTKMGTTFTGVCDLATFKAFSVYVGDVPEASLGFDKYKSPAPAIAADDEDKPEYGRRGIDRILVYSLLALRKRHGVALQVTAGVVSWPRHTLDDERRDLALNHPEGYGVKVRPSAPAATPTARLADIEALRQLCQGYGAQLSKAGAPGLAPVVGRPNGVRDYLPALPVGLTTSLQERRLVVGPKSWLEQGEDARELGHDHRRFGDSVQWNVREMGVTLVASGNADWDNRVSRIAANHGPMAASWTNFHADLNQWCRYYGVPAELMLALTGTESAGFNPRSCRVEDKDQTAMDNYWGSLGCAALAAGAHAAANNATACAPYNGWFDRYDLIQEEVNSHHAPNAATSHCAAYNAWWAAAPAAAKATSALRDAQYQALCGPLCGGIIPNDPAGAALVGQIDADVADQAPHRVSPGLIQTLIETARDDRTLRPESTSLGATPAAANAFLRVTVTTDWLLQAPHSIRVATSYVSREVFFQVNHEGTAFDPPLVSAAYNHGAITHVAALPAQPHNRWRTVHDGADNVAPPSYGHTDRVVQWFNEAVLVLRETTDRPDDTYHCYEDVHLDTFLLHHSKWELEHVVGDTTDNTAEPVTARVPPARPRAANLAQAYTWTNRQGPLAPTAVVPGRPQQHAALVALTRFIDDNLVHPQVGAGRVWMRLLWTFARDETTLKGVRYDHNVRVRGRVTDAGATELPDAHVVLASPAINVVVSRSGHYVLSHRADKFPAAVNLSVKIGAFESTAFAGQVAFPGETLVHDFQVTPITVTGPLNPAHGAAGTVVTITGTGLDAAAVSFGGTAAPNVNVVGGAQLTATTPAHGGGDVEVKITTASGTYTIPKGFHYG